MHLGQQVLDKISNLLVEIDRPKSPKKKINKPKQFTEKVKQVNDDKLYQNYKAIKQKALHRQQQKLRQQLQKMQPFKVQNKHSLFLNSLKHTKPIYERSADIIQQKQLLIQKKRTQIEQQKQRRKLQRQAIQQLDNDDNSIIKSKSQRKVATKEELDEIMKRLNEREKERLEKLNRQKMDYLKQKLMNNTEKPIMNKNSEKIWEKRKVQRELSPNVFERLQKYHWDYKKNHENYVNKIKEIQTPFKPSISKNSLMMINKSTASRTSITKDLDRTHSCKCFSKHNKSKCQQSNNKTFYPTQLSPNNSSMNMKSQKNLSTRH